ncbi:MAG: TonB-dependent receptor, partial [Candidatus Cloacimonetes bacterium]|nr:TonB-dependent receptor [Candidatus Cloacimonadota bacterium]
MRLIMILLLLCLSVAGLQAATVHGYVFEKSSREPMLYAAVMIKGTNLGQYTNKKGYFVINEVPSGEFEVFASKMGFQPLTISKKAMSAEETIYLEIELTRGAVQIAGLVIKAKQFEDEINSRQIKVSKINQSTEQLKEVVALAEADVMRSIQALPGVTPISDFSSGLYVRGGSPDQNLILLDCIDVYNPSHFGGIFSTFNTDAVKNVELLKGGYPATYHGRLSSVLDVTNREGNRKKFTGIARISMLSSSATVEGPWEMGGQKGSYMGSFRRTYLDVMKAAMDLEMPDVYFYDGHAKVNWDYSTKDKFSLSTYFGKDFIKFNFGADLLLQWGNETVSAQWTHLFNPQLFSHFVLAGSHFGSLFRVDYDSENNEYYDRANDIWDATFRAMLAWKPSESHLIEYGFDVKYNAVLLENTTNLDIDKSGLPMVDVSSATYSMYTQDSWDINAYWTFQAGLRATLCSTKSKYLANDPTTEYFRVAPRMHLRRKLTTTSNVFAAYGRYYQYLSMLSMDEMSPMDLWFPLDETVEPGVSNHYIFGY